MPSEKNIMPKVQLLHSLLGDSINDLTQHISARVSEKFDIPVEEALDKTKLLVTGYSICMLG